MFFYVSATNMMGYKDYFKSRNIGFKWEFSIYDTEWFTSAKEPSLPYLNESLFDYKYYYVIETT